MKPLYSIPKIGINHWFAIYHFHYKEKLEITEFIYNFYILYSNKLVSNRTRIFVYSVSCFCFRYSFGHLDNLSMAFFFTYNGRIYVIKPSLVTKKRKKPKTFLYLISHLFQSLSLLFGSSLLQNTPNNDHILGNIKICNNIQMAIQLNLGSKDTNKRLQVSHFCITYQIEWGKNKIDK